MTCRIRNCLRRRISYLFSVVALVFVFAPQANAQPKIWTQAGSAGVVDESSVGVVRLVQGEVTLLPAAPVSTQAVIRYNVVALEGLFVHPSPVSWPALGVRFRDNGPGSRVIVTLKSYDYTTGITNKILTLDSDQYPQSVTYQSRTIGDCANFKQFDFATKAYFVEVELSKTGVGGDPGVGVLS